MNSIQALVTGFLVALSFAVSAQQPARSGDEKFSRGLANGRYWASLETYQTPYICGLVDGWRFRESVDDYIMPGILQVIEGMPTSCREMADLVTAGYGDPVNIELPVGWVFLAELAVKRGATTPELVFGALRSLLYKSNHLTQTTPISELSPVSAILGASKK